MYSYEDPRNAELSRQAAEIFGFFAGSSSEHMNKEQFRALFLASGEEITSESEFDGLFAEVDGNDRDAKISLDEFTEWFKKDDSYEYSMRTKPLRDMKERLKTPAFYRSLQYFMGKNPGTTASTMNADGSILDIDLGVHVGKMAHQSPAWGFDLKFETVQSYDAPSISFELTYQDGLDFQEISHKISMLANIGAQAIGMGPAESPSQITIEGRPGIRVNIPLSQMHPVVMMAPMFLSVLKQLHFKVHLSQRLDDLNTDNVEADVGFKFQGQRSAFQMLGGLVVGQMGVDQKLWSFMSLMNHVKFSMGFENLNNVLDGKLAHQCSPTKVAAGKKELSKNVAVMLGNFGLNDILPLPVKNLHKVQVRLGNQQFSISGINLDVSFLFAEPLSGMDDPNRLQGDPAMSYGEHYEM